MTEPEHPATSHIGVERRPYPVKADADSALPGSMAHARRDVAELVQKNAKQGQPGGEPEIAW